MLQESPPSLIQAPPAHVAPTLVTVEGMFSAAHDTVMHNVENNDLTNLVVGYNFAGKLTFFCDFDELADEAAVGECWRALKAAGTDMWFSLLYSPFRFDSGDIIRIHRLFAVAMLVGSVAGEGNTEGMLCLLRNGGLVRLPATLAGLKHGTPQFTFNYNDKPH